MSDSDQRKTRPMLTSQPGELFKGQRNTHRGMGQGMHDTIEDLLTQQSVPWKCLGGGSEMALSTDYRVLKAIGY